MRIIEINHVPMLKTRFPEETEFIDTGFSFTDDVGIKAKLRRVLGHFTRLLRLTLAGKCDLIFCRSMGRFIYRTDASPFSNALRVIMRACILLCVGGLVRRGARLGVIDSWDEATLDRRDLFLLRRCRWYFKRELPQNAWNAMLRLRWRYLDQWDLPKIPSLQPLVGKFAPLSLGISADRCRQIDEALGRPPAPADKRYDVFFSGTLDQSTVRVDGQRQLEALRARGYRVEIHTRHLPYAEFVEKMRASWLVWSPEGGGWDCYRHYEAAVAGSVPLVNHATIRRHAPLRHGEHCIEYAIEGDDFCRQVEAALADKARLWQITEAARPHVLRHHTHAALAEYMRAALTGPDVDPTGTPPLPHAKPASDPAAP